MAESRMFRLGMFAPGNSLFTGLVLSDENIVDLADAAKRAGVALPAFRALVDLLSDWDTNFDRILQVADHARSVDPREARAIALKDANPRPPLGGAGRLLYAAANYSDHVKNIRKTFTPDIPMAGTEENLPPLRPYMFGKMSEPTGAFDDIILPEGINRVDWEAELMVAIGRPAHKVRAQDVGQFIAGYVTTNDVSCRDLTWREDRPSIRSDWLAGKSFDSFAPIGPYFTPRQFVADHANLRIRLWVNGEIKQDGNSGDMIFNIEEQIEYASRMLTLKAGDLIATGTPAGTGQERLEFLKEGDIVECEVELCGRQRNRVVSEIA